MSLERSALQHFTTIQYLPVLKHTLYVASELVVEAFSIMTGLAKFKKVSDNNNSQLRLMKTQNGFKVPLWSEFLWINDISLIYITARNPFVDLWCSVFFFLPRQWSGFDSGYGYAKQLDSGEYSKSNWVYTHSDTKFSIYIMYIYYSFNLLYFKSPFVRNHV